MRGLLGRLRKANEPMEVEYSGSSAMKVATLPTLSEELKYRKAKLEEELKNTNNAIEALEKYPEVLTVLEQLSKLGY